MASEEEKRACRVSIAKIEKNEALQRIFTFLYMQFSPTVWLQQTGKPLDRRKLTSDSGFSPTPLDGEVIWAEGHEATVTTENVLS